MTEDAFIAAVLGNPVNRAILDRRPPLGLAERAKGDRWKALWPELKVVPAAPVPAGPVAPTVTAKQ
jgi:hypothetical protein